MLVDIVVHSTVSRGTLIDLLGSAKIKHCSVLFSNRYAVTMSLTGRQVLRIRDE